MKRFFAILTVVILTTTIASSQARIGMKAGNTLSNVYGDDVTNTDMRFGFHTGMFFQFGNDRVKYGLETLWNQKGFNSEYTYDVYDPLGGYYYIVSEDVTFTLNYLYVNNNLSIFVADPVSLNIGLQLGLFLGGNAEGETLDYDDVTALDLGINSGVTWWINDAINVEARYTLGLLDVPWESSVSFYNSAIQLSIGWAFVN